MWFSKKKAKTPERRDTALLAQLDKISSPSGIANCVSDALCEGEELEVAAIYADIEGVLERVGLGIASRPLRDEERPQETQNSGHSSVQRIPIDDDAPEEEAPVEEPWEEILPLRLGVKEAQGNGWYEEIWNGIWLCSPQVAHLPLDDLRANWRSTRSLLTACIGEVQAQRRSQESVVQTELHSEFARAATDHGAALRLLLNALLGALGADRGGVARIADEGAAPEILSIHGAIDEAFSGAEIVSIAETWQVIISEPERLAPGAKALWALASPLRVGALLVIAGSSRPPDVFPQDTEERLRSVLGIMSELCESDDAIIQARARLRGLLSGLAEVADVGVEVGSHREAVQHVCAGLADALGIEEDEKEALLRAAELHDCGELHFGPEADDTANAFLHPMVGAQLVQTLGESPRVVELIRAHHETADGLGFPAGSPPLESDAAAWALIVAELYVERRKGFSSDADWWASLKGALPPSLWTRWSKKLSQRSDVWPRAG